ncbi:DUF4198 domain-containing protein [Hymenobacter psychrophilus]|uniref:Uncharacterized conserved protein, contains GH25 family domain n=1 Tax=Hymenobacter psychrophilus TaxID=651662 RepID=A0A1H3J040_9BACT|nr:DUF4198 domain-containing protein [Hymenobacter psychrophilus]SDY33320.1 Uncharacterized conserved protein, contains GH25 family domain [Hymenobacter psychrophilus]
MKHLLSVLLVLLLTASTALLANEFWLEPTRFVVAPGARVHLRRLSGEDFRGQPWAGRRARLELLRHYAPGAPFLDLLTASASAANPTATTDTIQSTVTLHQPGTHLVALVTNNAIITLEAARFSAYLQQEGLDNVLALREQRGQTTEPGREAYRRCAKTLVQAGPPNPADTARAWARPVGLPLELVPEQNPYHLAPEAPMTVRVLRAGQPVAGQLVVLWRRGAQPQALLQKIRSNQNGRVLLHLSGPGQYLVSTVRMESAPAAAGADWQSTWSTLTFGLPGKARL